MINASADALKKRLGNWGVDVEIGKKNVSQNTQETEKLQALIVISFVLTGISICGRAILTVSFMRMINKG